MIHGFVLLFILFIFSCLLPNSQSIFQDLLYTIIRLFSKSYALFPKSSPYKKRFLFNKILQCYGPNQLYKSNEVI